MKLSASLLLPLTFTSAQQQQQQQVLQGERPSSNPTKNVINVAIIGAGAGGSSAAYSLSQYSTLLSSTLNLTIFDRNPYIGGRSTTVYAHDDPSTQPIELGASIFVQVNKILVEAAQTFNLTTTGADDNPKGIPGSALGVWDGKTFVLELASGGGWWDSAKLIWKYGLAPIKTQRMMKSVVGKFLKLYEPADLDAPEAGGFFPFSSLTAATRAIGLEAVLASTGEQFLRENGISAVFAREVIQASTRVNYAQNLNYIHGLEAMVCMATDGAMAVKGGNWQIFNKMAKASGARKVLGFEVSDLEKSSKRGYTLHYAKATNDEDAPTDRKQEQHFDVVILAAPYQFTNISLPSSSGIIAPERIPYVQLHVTLFTSPHLLSPTFFRLSQDQPVPQVILTTLSESERPKDGAKSVGTPGFFSISLLRTAANPKTGGEEYLYKVFSASPISDAWLKDLLGVQSSSSVNLDNKDVSWILRKVWYSYPYEYPRVTFEDTKLGPDLWYTSGMDSFISTMETNALMGRNVARLVVDDLLEKSGD